jgi:hypothetical protein
VDERIVDDASALDAALAELGAGARRVFFAGLPGTGKSLLIHRLAHLAHGQGRQVDLLQWDVARPVFEASAPGRRFPQERGVTHGVIRLAVGRWARQALVGWDRAHAGAAHLLIGETPFVGHRLIELARPADDAAEPLLAGPSTRFVLPVPSRAVRAHVEAERARRTAHPRHAREREDAPPEVLRDLWRELVAVARALGVEAAPPESVGDPPYDPAVYQRVYARLLVGRHATTLWLDTVLPERAGSVYDFQVPTGDLVPSEDEAARFVDAEARRAPEAVWRQVTTWWAASVDAAPPRA